MTRLLFSAGVSGVVASPLPDFCAAIHCESLQFTGGRDARIPATRKDICVISNHHPVSFGEPLWAAASHRPVARVVGPFLCGAIQSEELQSGDSRHVALRPSGKRRAASRQTGPRRVGLHRETVELADSRRRGLAAKWVARQWEGARPLAREPVFAWRTVTACFESLCRSMRRA